MKPRIILLVDYPFWAFDSVARSLLNGLGYKYSINIEYVCHRPNLKPNDIDLLYVFFWGETYYRKFGFMKHQVIKEVASWRWRDDQSFGRLTTKQFCDQYLSDCTLSTTPSAQIWQEISRYYPQIVHCPNGVDWAYFRGKSQLSGPLRIGWAGNPGDTLKGLHDIIVPSSEGYLLKTTSGHLTRRQMRSFYLDIDVLAIASVSESQPLTLLEAMASGCFPVSVNVGIVPEVITDKLNGLVVARSVEAFREGFEFVNHNLNTIRAKRLLQSRFAKSQDWSHFYARFDQVFELALSGLPVSTSLMPDEMVIRKNDSPQFSSTNYMQKSAYSSFRRIAIDAKDDLDRLWLGDRHRLGSREFLRVLLVRIKRTLVDQLRLFGKVFHGLGNMHDKLH